MPDVLGDKKLPPVMQESQEGRRYLVAEDLPGDKNTRQEKTASSCDAKRQEGRRYLVEEDLPGDKNTRQEETASSCNAKR